MLHYIESEAFPPMCFFFQRSDLELSFYFGVMCTGCTVNSKGVFCGVFEYLSGCYTYSNNPMRARRLWWKLVIRWCLDFVWLRTNFLSRSCCFQLHEGLIDSAEYLTRCVLLRRTGILCHFCWSMSNITMLTICELGFFNLYQQWCQKWKALVIKRARNNLSQFKMLRVK